MTRVIKASEFKAKCLKLIDEVALTGEPIVVTKRGRRVVTVSAGSQKRPSAICGIFKGQIELLTSDGELPSLWDKGTQAAREARMHRLVRDIAPRTTRAKRS